VCFIYVASPSEEVNRLEKALWKTELSVCKYDSDKQRSKQDELILESIERTAFNVDGTYQVGQIWKEIKYRLARQQSRSRDVLTFAGETP